MGLRILLDEDVQSHRLVRALREAGHDVLPVGEAGLNGASDIDVLDFAVRANRVLFTRNCSDFRELHDSDPEHAGIVVIFRYNDPAKDLTYAQIVNAFDSLMEASCPLRHQFIKLNDWNW